jgi:Helix-turn-helix domain
MQSDDAMSIKRAPRPDSHFTILSNDVLRDQRLSFRARGLLASILSRPDNWSTNAESLARESKEGRNSILTALKELEDNGYLVRRKYQNELGHWVSESVVFDEPKFRNPTSVEPTSVEPTSDEPTSENGTLLEETTRRTIKKKHKEETIRNITSDVADEHKQLATVIDSQAQQLAQQFCNQLHANGIHAAKVTPKWITELDRMQRIDGRTWEQIEACIQWATKDPFWSGVILSPTKLRKHYDQMNLQARKQNTTPQNIYGKLAEMYREQERNELE